jgi:AcrR family transcriptional regulator
MPIKPAMKAVGKTTRERLIDIAAQLFSERGYHNTALEDIARAVGIGPSAIYKHFANKLDLYRAVLDQLAAPFLALLEEFEPDVNAVDFAERIFRYHIAHPALARLTLQASLSGGEHRRLLIEHWYRPYYEKTALRMRGSAALGHEAPLIPSEFITFNNLVLGYINLAALHAETLGVDPFSPAVIEQESELLRRFSDTLMHYGQPAPTPAGKTGKTAPKRQSS